MRFHGGSLLRHRGVLGAAAVGRRLVATRGRGVLAAVLRRRPDPAAFSQPVTLHGRRVVLRPLSVHDFEAWREVRRRNHDWLTKWEPQRMPNQPDTIEDRQAFASRCAARMREIQLGSGYVWAG